MQQRYVRGTSIGVFAIAVLTLYFLYLYSITNHLAYNNLGFHSLSTVPQVGLASGGKDALKHASLFVSRPTRPTRTPYLCFACVMLITTPVSEFVNCDTGVVNKLILYLRHRA